MLPFGPPLTPLGKIFGIKWGAIRNILETWGTCCKHHWEQVGNTKVSPPSPPPPKEKRWALMDVC